MRPLLTLAATIAALSFSASAALVGTAHATPPSQFSVTPDGVDWEVSVAMNQGRLGLQVQTLTPELREFFGAPKDAGILVGSIQKNSAGDRAGIEIGDVIVKVNTRSIDEPWDVVGALASAKEGDLVELSVIRNKKKVRLKATMTHESLSEGGSLGPKFGQLGPTFGQRGPTFGQLDPTFGQLGPHAGWDLDSSLTNEELRKKLAEAEERFKALETRLRALEKRK